MNFCNTLDGFFPADELVYSTTWPDSITLPPIVFRDLEIPRRTHKQGIKVLGTYIAFDGSFGIEVDYRIARAWGTFCKFKAVLCAFTQNLVTRLRRLDTTVKKTLLFGSGSWNLSQSQQQKLTGFQYKCIRKMIRFRRRSFESIEHFMRRTNGCIKSLLQMPSIEKWDCAYVRQTWAEAGRIGIINATDPNRLSNQVHLWKNLARIQEVQVSYGQQCHGYRFKVWRSETSIVQTFGNNWLLDAADKSTWRSKVLDAIERSRFDF